MAYTFNVGAVSSPVASGAVTLDFPATRTTGDIFVAFLAIRDTTGFTQATWTKVHESLTGDNDSTNGVASAQVWWWRYDGTGSSVTFSRTGGDLGYGVIIGVSGCVASGSPIDAQNITTTTSSSLAFPDVTATAGGDPRALLVFSAFGDNGNTTAAATSTTPSGGTWNYQNFTGTNTGSDGGGCVHYHNVGLPASTATSTIAASTTTGGTHVLSTIALKPAAAADLSTSTPSESFAGTTKIKDTVTRATVDLAASGSETFAGTFISDTGSGITDLWTQPSEAFTLLSETGEGAVPVNAEASETTLTLTDAGVLTVDLEASGTESFTAISDTGSGRLLLLRASASESLTASISGQVEWRYHVRLTDSAVGETVGEAADLSVPDAAEAFTLISDTGSGVTDAWVRPSETFTLLSETAVMTVDLEASAAEAFTAITDAGVLTVDLEASASEAFTAISDTGAGRLLLLLASASESFTALTDTGVATVDLAASASETFTALTDAGSGRLLLLLASGAETDLTLTDAGVGDISLSAEASEAFTLISETGAATVDPLLVTSSEAFTLISETATGITDAWARPSEALTAISDTGAGRLSPLRASGSETVTVSNTPAPQGQVVDEGALVPSITPEAFTAITDTGSARLLLLRASASESLTASETAVGKTGLWAQPSDGFTALTDTGTGRLLLLRASASETVTVSNTPAPQGDVASSTDLEGLPAPEGMTLTASGAVEWRYHVQLSDTATGQVFDPLNLPALASEYVTALADVRPPQADVVAGGGTLTATPDAEAFTLISETGVIRWQWWLSLTDAGTGQVIDPNDVTIAEAESATVWDQVRGAVVLAPGDLATADPDERVTTDEAGQVFWISALTLTDTAVGEAYNWESGGESWDQDAGDEYVLAVQDRTPIGEVGTFGVQLTDQVVAHLSVLVATASESDLTLTDPEAEGSLNLRAQYTETLYVSNTPAPQGQLIDPTNLEVPDAAEAFTLISDDPGTPLLVDMEARWEDAVYLSDTAAGSLDLRASASETLDLSDTGVAVLPVLEASVSEALTATDVVVDIANDRLEPVASETLTVSDTAVGYRFGLPADDRTWVVRAESRVWTVEAEDRRWRVPAEDRVWMVDAEDRVWTVPEDDTDVEV